MLSQKEAEQKKNVWYSLPFWGFHGVLFVALKDFKNKTNHANYAKVIRWMCQSNLYSAISIMLLLGLVGIVL